MKVNPNRAERRNVLGAKRKRRQRHKPKRKYRDIDPLAMQAIDGLQQAIKVAAKHRIEVGVTRLGGTGQKLDSYHVAFYWTGIGRNTPVLVASWYPTKGVAYIGTLQRTAATIGEALAVVLDAIVGPGTSATTLTSELRDKPAPVVKGRARKIKPERKIVGEPPQWLPEAKPRH